jgi:hypothetical protein
MRLFGSLLTHISVPPLSQSELVSVIQFRFPNLSSLAALLVDTFIFLQEGMSRASSSIRGRILSSRDLLKWCTRIDRLGYAKGEAEKWDKKDLIPFPSSSSSSSSSSLLSLLPLHLRELVFLEGMDCFCACVWEKEEREKMVNRLGKYWEIGKEKIEYFCGSYKPGCHKTETSYSVGRVTLPIVMKVEYPEGKV